MELGRDLNWKRPLIVAICATILGICVAMLMAITRAALAHEHGNPSWIGELSSPYAGVCCNGDDVILDPPWEFRDNRYRVMINGNWLEVPPSAVVDPHKNRDGTARVWPSKTYANPPIYIRCFLPGTLT